MAACLTTVDCGTSASYSTVKIWNTWNDETGHTTPTITGSDTLTGSTIKIWGIWTTAGTTSNITVINTDAAWITWTTANDPACSGSTTIVSPPNVYVDPRTPEQFAADEARYAARLAEETAQLAKRPAASVRARALLLSMLDVQQRERLQRDRYFDVIARHSQRRYRIRQGTHGNVRLLDADGREVTSYCGQPNGLPTEDCMLAQKLQIEYDEVGFLKVANASRVA